MVKDYVIQEMKKIYHVMPSGITHTFDVLRYTKEIMKNEKLTKEEKEGEVISRYILEKINYNLIDRVCYIVGNHHTKTAIDGLDFQIIWEADMLVNLDNKNLSKEELKKCIDDNFKTELGKKIAYDKYMND